MSKLVVVIQCDIVTKRCSGYACMNTFVNRKDTFADYPPDTRFLMMTCGGCC
ncbi:MAG: CGGC domain-containing protein, partial [Megasphaera elsdenii]|nr:CGGC domain-containing protein [Megasphaera elsdenii]